MPTITVQAAAGVRVPMFDKPKRHITDAAPVQIEINAYYRRRMTDGDLVEVKAPKEVKNGKS